MPKFTFVTDPTQLTFEAAAPGKSLLLVQGARLARAEVNANQDEITPEGIDQLAASIGGRAADLEHDRLINCGVFTRGEGVDDPDLGRMLQVDMLVWADRFPDIAAGIQTGAYGLSIEADGESVTCSICGNRFEGAAQYCEHLRNRRLSGAIRRFDGLTAVGGGIVKNPAGTGAGFGQAAIRFVASHLENEEAPMDQCPYCGQPSPGAEKCPKCEHGLTAAAMAPDLAKALSDLQKLAGESDGKTAELATTTDQLGQVQAELDTVKASLQAKSDELTAAQEALQAKTAELEAATGDLQTATETARRMALGNRLTDAEWQEKKSAIMAMPQDGFDAMLQLIKPAKPSGVIVEGSQRLDDKPPAKREIVTK